jgi:transposase
MDGFAGIKEDLLNGRIDAQRLIERLELLERQLHKAAERIVELERRNAELEKQLGASGVTPKLAESYSMKAEEKRQQARGKKKRHRQRSKRRGRLTTTEKLKLAKRTDDVYPDAVPKSDCQLSHTRVVWRLEDNQAVLIAYRVYRGPKNQYGKIPGALGRSEFGLEIVVTISHLVYVVGLSFDKVCQVLKFFQNLELGKSQVDALLRRLARHWEKEFEILCTLLANSLIVHADETSWSLNSVWAFLSEKARVLLFGVHKDADTLKVLLNPESFAGLVISDDAAVYGSFSASQKCWAHLLRKAIKLTLLEPKREDFRQFTDRLLAIYRSACRAQRDRRLSDAGRRRKVFELYDEIFELCFPVWDRPPSQGADDDFRLLVNEVMRLIRDHELFTFVTAKPAQQPNGNTLPAGGTNNEAERTLRNPAQARATGRTNKTPAGARRQSVLTTVLESLRLYLKSFTLTTVLAEVERWSKVGRSCFARLLHKLKLTFPSENPVLDRLFPKPSPDLSG